jgi:predicted small secreted protein
MHLIRVKVFNVRGLYKTNNIMYCCEEVLYGDFMKRFTIFIILLGMTLLSACNTIGGFGEDLRKAGTAIEGAANRGGE